MVSAPNKCVGGWENHTHALDHRTSHTHMRSGLLGSPLGQLWQRQKMSEDVRRCQKMSENIQKNQKKIILHHSITIIVAKHPPRNLPFIILNQQTNITALILKCHYCGKVPKATATDPKVFIYPNPHSLSLLLHVSHFSIHFTPHSPLPTLQ